MEGIDLTLEALFWGDEDPNQLQRHHYLYTVSSGSSTVFSEFGFNHLARRIRNEIDIDVFERIFGSEILDERRIENNFIDAWQNFYFDIFGVPSPDARHYDPLAHFLFSCGILCDRCGITLDIINRASGGHEYTSLCEKCDYETTDNFMEIT